MAWYKNGRKYWKHNGRIYSSRIKQYFWKDSRGKNHKTDFCGALDSIANGTHVYTNDFDIINGKVFKSNLSQSQLRYYQSHIHKLDNNP